MLVYINTNYCIAKVKSKISKKKKKTQPENNEITESQGHKGKQIYITFLVY